MRRLVGVLDQGSTLAGHVDRRRRERGAREQVALAELARTGGDHRLELGRGLDALGDDLRVELAAQPHDRRRRA